MKVKKLIKIKNHAIMYIAFIILIAAIYNINTVYTKEKESIVEGLSDSLIRFHVIANSDLEEDQLLKIKVKDEVILEMKKLLKNSKSVDESREIIKKNMESLKEIAQKIILEEGYNYPVEISLGEEMFPLKKYGDIVLPPGKYEALIIKIGEAKGKNWWCVLFPPLCFVDATHGVVDSSSKEQLKQVLTEKEYNSIIMDKNSDIDIKIKFKTLDWLKEKEKELKKDAIFAKQLTQQN